MEHENLKEDLRKAREVLENLNTLSHEEGSRPSNPNAEGTSHSTSSWATTKLTPSLAARLGPEVNHEDIKSGRNHHRSSHHSVQQEFPGDKNTTSLKSPAAAPPPSAVNSRKSKRSRPKENSVVEIFDSDHEDRDGKDPGGIEVIDVEKDFADVPVPSRKKERSKKKERKRVPDVMVIEEKSHGPPSSRKTDKENRKKGSPHRYVQ